MSPLVFSGCQTAQPPASLPGCLSAPITRQSSFWKTPRPHSIIHPLPASHPMAVTPRHPGPMSAAVTPSQVAAAARQQGSPCKLPAVAGPGSRAAGRQQTCQAPQGGSAMPDAALMLPDLSHCPSVASAPCTTGACKPRRHPGNRLAHSCNQSASSHAAQLHFCHTGHGLTCASSHALQCE